MEAIPLQFLKKAKYQFCPDYRFLFIKHTGKGKNRGLRDDKEKKKMTKILVTSFIGMTHKEYTIKY